MPFDLTQMKLDMNNMRNDIKNISAKQDEIHSDLKEFIESSKGEFAGKWTEKLLITVGTAVVLSLVGAVMALIVRYPS